VKQKKSNEVFHKLWKTLFTGEKMKKVRKFPYFSEMKKRKSPFSTIFSQAKHPRFLCETSLVKQKKREGKKGIFPVWN